MEALYADNDNKHPIIKARGITWHTGWLTTSPAPQGTYPFGLTFQNKSTIAPVDCLLPFISELNVSIGRGSQSWAN